MLFLGSALVACGGGTPEVPNDAGISGDGAPGDAGGARTTLARFEPGPPLLEARDHHVSFVVVLPDAPYLYVLGGIQNDMTPIVLIERARIEADGTLGPFAAAGSLPTWTAGGAVAVDGTTIYVFSGLRQSGASATHQPLVDIGSAQTDGSITWRAGPPMRGGRAHGGAVVVGRRVYVVGGLDDSFVNNASAESAEILPNGDLGAWREEASLPTTRSHHSLVTDGRRLILTGGLTGDSRVAPALATALAADVGSDGVLSAWRDAGSLDTGRATHSSVYRDGFIYFFGGIDSADVLASNARAPLQEDGTLGAFEPTVSWGDGRAHAHQAPSFGAHVYIVAGATFGAGGHHDSHSETFVGTFE